MRQPLDEARHRHDAYATVEALTAETAARVAGDAAIGVWQSYTPSLSASTTNPTLGTGATTTGAYVKVQQTVVGWFNITFGTGATAGSGNYWIGIPASTNASYGGSTPVGRVRLNDSSGGVSAYFDLVPSGGTILLIRYNATWPTGADTFVTNAVPWTWADGDSIRGTFVYQSV